MKYKNFGKENQLLLLDVLDYIVEQGNMNTWISVSSKKFYSFLIDILKSQNDAEIQTKLLQLIQKWGIDFQSKSDVIPNFYRVYNIFKSNGVVFPPREQSNYYKYIDRSKSNNGNDYPDEENNNDDDDNNMDDLNSNEFEYMESIKSKLKVSNFEHKYRRLIDYLLRMQENIKIANIFINKKEINRVREPINTLKKGNKTLIDTISTGRLRDDTLMEITLGTTEDINQTISREEEMKTGNTPNKFTSYFVLNEIFPIKGNSNKARAKSVKKKGALNQRNNFNIMEQSNNNNNKGDNNIKNVDDIFDLFSATKPQNINEQPNNQGNMFNNNNNNNFYNNSNNNFNNNDNNLMISSQINNNNMNSINNNFSQNNFNNNYVGNNQNFDFPNLTNMQNNNTNSNEFDMYGPAPQINSNQLTQYIGPFNQNNNNNYPNFNGGNQNNFSSSQNVDFRNNNDNNNMMSNNFGNNMNNNFGQQKTQEEIEREERLKELDELF